MTVNTTTTKCEITFFGRVRDIKDMSLSELKQARDGYKESIEELEGIIERCHQYQTKKEELLCDTLNRYNDVCTQLKAKEKKDSKEVRLEIKSPFSNYPHQKLVAHKAELEDLIKELTGLVNNFERISDVKKREDELASYKAILTNINREISYLEVEEESRQDFFSALRV